MTRDEFLAAWSFSDPDAISDKTFRADLDTLLAEARREAREQVLQPLPIHCTLGAVTYLRGDFLPRGQVVMSPDVYDAVLGGNVCGHTHYLGNRCERERGHVGRHFSAETHWQTPGDTEPALATPTKGGP